MPYLSTTNTCNNLTNANMNVLIIVFLIFATCKNLYHIVLCYSVLGNIKPEIQKAILYH